MKTRVMISALALLAAIAGQACAAPGRALDANGHFALAAPASSAAFSFVPVEGGVQVRIGAVAKNIIFYGPKTVRVNTTLGENYWKHPSIVVIDKPDNIGFTTQETATTLTLKSAGLSVIIDKATGAVTFTDASGKVYTQEKQAAPQSLNRIEISGAPTYEAQNTFQLKPEEAIYGFGFVGQGELNRRGKNLLLVQTNIGIVIPVMVSSERYGILWDTYSKMRFSDSDAGATLWAESAPGGVDYYFMAGDTMDAVVGGYRELTGQAPMFPKQAFGLFMSKERYQTQARLLEVAKTFRQEQFPLDYIVQDWQYWGSDKDGTWSGMIWNPERFPDPKGAIDTLHDMNLKLMVSIWPSVGNDTELARDLDSKNLRFEPLHWISKKARIYDAFSPEGRATYFKHVKKGLLDVGVDALWMDGTEVEVGTAVHDAGETERDIKLLGNNALGDFTRYLNPYSLMTTQGTYDGQRATSNKRALTLTRSAWAGAQRTAAVSWSGDTFASWKTFGEQIDGGVNVTITGTPYWTQDTGGFFVKGQFPEGEQSPAYRELFARWAQYAAFNPLMRIHGTDIEREPYIFKTLDPEVYTSLRASVDLRYRLLPYTYGLSWQVTHNGYTMMRALPMDFPEDRGVHNINDAFMFGPSFLVHPVTRPMYRFLAPPAQTIPATALRTPDGKPGLAGQYFDGTNFETPKGKTVDATIDMRWPGPPLTDIPAGLTALNNFSARWEGTVIAPEDGEYELGLDGDDGLRLFVDGKLLVEDWNFGAARYRGGKVTLKKGQSVALKLEYFQGGGNRSLRLAWRTPSQIAEMANQKTEIDAKVTTYLPKGAGWYDFWTQERFEGGASVKKTVPLDIVPLYVRAGAIVPMGPKVQYATEQPGADYEVRVYPGADGRFTVYEDDNETYNYEKGQYATYEMVWDDAGRTLSIGARKGSYPGLVQSRKLNVVIVGAANAAGISPAAVTKSVTYSGKAVKLTF
ncbi:MULTISPECIES: TIM-barrel domain-containing protein [Asticcacaulis]|uniref:glycoside hydrolase family 31 protein n=1 Tax=Asticcacaulis TaxID=76890 RepID=UPI001AE522A8|nr:MULTISPECIES: TIM-barrel domain-containing protein [Asticcacaulis]MBP2160440.1 alpha-D-xyloside xylohydrolase [Asticcacaulis solisilvae]MDR6801485.1 alpha-D-xyloside xylohydrolase [Asticcacaulis sp. BE141]